LDIEKYLQLDYWKTSATALQQWFLRDVWVVETLLELVVIVLCIVLGGLVARPFKPRLVRLIEERNWQAMTIGRFLGALHQVLAFAAAVVLLGFAMALFQRFEASRQILNMAVSLLSAWVLIRLVTSVLKDPGWRRYIAMLAWTLAALHILNLLQSFLELLDRLAITLGCVRISILLIIKAVIFLTILLRLSLGASSLLEKRIKTMGGLTPSIQVLLSKALKITLLATAVIVTLSSLGINLSAFAFFGGAIGVGVGFGLQKVVSNLVSGIILLLDRSIKPGDVIEIGSTYGRIESLGARYVSVATRDNTEYLIPNEDLITTQVVNWSFSDKLVRLKVVVGVSYDSDIHQVMRIMVAAAVGIPRVLDDPKPVCQLKNFGDSSIDMELRLWISDPENGVSNVSSDVRIAIWDAFKANSIEIPFPQRDLHIKSGFPESQKA
jgi:small-conductance mechanosensitive channel